MKLNWSWKSGHSGFGYWMREPSRQMNGGWEQATGNGNLWDLWHWNNLQFLNSKTMKQCWNVLNAEHNVMNAMQDNYEIVQQQQHWTNELKLNMILLLCVGTHNNHAMTRQDETKQRRMYAHRSYVKYELFAHSNVRNQPAK